VGRYYYGSYGLVRGYGPLATSYARADWSVRQDGKEQRANGGCSDRIAIVVDAETGLCWWLDGDEDDWDERDLYPVRAVSGSQARYQREAIEAFERVFFGPRELAGFG
jgi:hypothetical protein